MTMQNPPNYVTREYVIPANGTVEGYREASFMTCLEATAAFSLKIDNAAKFDFEAGLGIVFDGTFTRYELINETGTDITVKLAIGRGNVRDARLVISGTLSTQSTVPDTLTTGAAVSALNAATTSVIAANTSRVEALVVNAGAATIYIGGNAAAAAAEGLPLAAGQSLTLNTTAAIYARNDTGAAVAVSVAEVERS